jgi:hypothetical protein
MPQHWDDQEKVSTRLHAKGRAGRICLFIAAFFAVLGIIGNTIQTTVIFELMSWFLMAIAGFFMTFLIGRAISRYFETTEAKKREQTARLRD